VEGEIIPEEGDGKMRMIMILLSEVRWCVCSIERAVVCWLPNFIKF